MFPTEIEVTKLDPVRARMRDVTQLLFVFEAGAIASSESQLPTVARISERLRHQICSLAGDVGYRSLLASALNLAIEEAPGLRTLRVNADGSLEGLGELARDEIDKSGAALITKFLLLLSNFIGEPLMLHLLRDEWPSLPSIDEIPSGEQR